jgi:hypothetical protein
LAYRNEVQQSPLIGAIHKKVLEAGLRTQNYDKGMDKFVRKFDPDEEMSAVVAVHSGWQTEHAWSVYFEQGPRRCLLLDTVDGMLPEEVLWTALTAWVTFNPRSGNPRKFPGRLFYPDEATAIMMDCWNHFEDLSASPGFSNKTPICQAEMMHFSEALCRLDHSTWYPQPTAEADEKSARFAEDSCVRYRTDQINGKCTGVVRLQSDLPHRDRPQAVQGQPPVSGQWVGAQQVVALPTPGS